MRWLAFEGRRSDANNVDEVDCSKDMLPSGVIKRFEFDLYLLWLPNIFRLHGRRDGFIASLVHLGKVLVGAALASLDRQELPSDLGEFFVRLVLCRTESRTGINDVIDRYEGRTDEVRRVRAPDGLLLTVNVSLVASSQTLHTRAIHLSVCSFEYFTLRGLTRCLRISTCNKIALVDISGPISGLTEGVFEHSKRLCWRCRGYVAKRRDVLIRIGSWCRFGGRTFEHKYCTATAHVEALSSACYGRTYSLELFG